jgi:hypothetical protein
VVEYFYYNEKTRDSVGVPDMEIPPELCLELLMAADYLDTWKEIPDHKTNGTKFSENCGHTPLTHVANKRSKRRRRSMTIEEDFDHKKDPQTCEASCKHLTMNSLERTKSVITEGKSRNDRGWSPYQ